MPRITAIRAEGISFRYQGQRELVLNSIDFELAPGQIAAIVGSSGCGKSTLGYCLCGVIPKLIAGDFSGRVQLQGRAGIVFQDPDNQIFLPSVEDELAFGPENLCCSREEIETRISNTLALIGLTGQRGENPGVLSGGQKKLVVLGAVLTLCPDIIVLDEALDQLDEAARERIKPALAALKRKGKAVIMIDHDRKNIDIADQIWRLERGKLVLLTGFR